MCTKQAKNGKDCKRLLAKALLLAFNSVWWCLMCLQLGTMSPKVELMFLHRVSTSIFYVLSDLLHSAKREIPRPEMHRMWSHVYLSEAMCTCQLRDLQQIVFAPLQIRGQIGQIVLPIRGRVAIILPTETWRNLGKVEMSTSSTSSWKTCAFKC